jgi:predicted phage terminase large subunit-like protein
MEQVINPRAITPCQFRAILRADFPSFIQKCFRALNPGSAYLPNWHIDALAYHLELVRHGEIKRLIVNMPPRSLKSIVASVAFPAFALGHDPTLRIIGVSYGSDLAAKHSNDFRAILGTTWFRQVFPATRISHIKNTEGEVATTANGYRLATSVDGTLTGRGGDIVLIDDPLKPADALSDPRRERVNEWYNSTLLSRLDNKQHGRIVIVMQRLHMDDLTGWLRRSSDEWTLLELPAIAEEEQRVLIGDGEYHVRQVDDLLHAEREPRDILERLQRQFGSNTFAAQYQQRPVPPGGAMVKRAWARRYEHLPPRCESRVTQSWDTASKEGAQNDWSVCTTWYVHEKRFYLADVLRGRYDYPRLRARAIEHASAHQPSRILIEDTGVGTALLAELKNAGRSAIAIKPERDKVTRMSIASAKFESGLVLLPSSAPWLAGLEDELFSFPQGRHDDQVDSISQALNYQGSSYDASLSWVC